MLKRDEIGTAVSCLNKAAEDEPLFVLRANDETAPGVVMAWATDYKAAKGGWFNMSELQQQKYNEACKIASDMRIWKMHHSQRGQAK